MKKKNLLTCLAVSLFAVILASCGGESKNMSQEEAPVSLQVKPESTTVTGKLGNAFTIEDKSYKLSNDGIFYYISVSLTRTDAEPSIPFDDVVSIYSDDTKASYNGSFDVELYDANGNEIYEGDILREIRSCKLVQVVYDAPEFCFKNNVYGYRFLNHPENFEVIGNIYDNPDYLNGGEV